MKKLATLVAAGAAVALVVVALAPAAGSGESYKVSAALRNNTEVPRAKGAPLAKGAFTGAYVENTSGATLTWKLTFSHLTGAAGAAHIHQGARGKSGPVIVPLCAPCKSGQTGRVHISKAVIEALEKGNAYVNVHTAKNPGGEIRNQIKVAES